MVFFSIKNSGNETIIEQPARFTSNVVFSGSINNFSDPQNIFVSVSGSDSGNGSILNPYRTVGKAVEVINTLGDSSITKQYVVNVGPGRFVETALPMTLRIGTQVKGAGENATRITTTLTGSTFFELTTRSYLTDFSLVGGASGSYTNKGVQITHSTSLGDISEYAPKFLNVSFINLREAIQITGVSASLYLFSNTFSDNLTAIDVYQSAYLVDMYASLITQTFTTGSGIVFNNIILTPDSNELPIVRARTTRFRNCYNAIYSTNSDTTKGSSLAINASSFISCSNVVNLNDASVISINASRAYSTRDYEFYQGHPNGKLFLFNHVCNFNKFFIQQTGVDNAQGIIIDESNKDIVRLFGPNPQYQWRVNTHNPETWRMYVNSNNDILFNLSTDSNGNFSTYSEPVKIRESGSLVLRPFKDPYSMDISGTVYLTNRTALRFYDSGSARYVELAAPVSFDSNLTYKLPATVPVTSSYLLTDTSGNLSWTTGIGGETNTASNVGTGFGLYYQKVGSDLQFKSLVAGTGVTLTSSSLGVTMSISSTGEANTASNVGSGFGVFAQKSGVDLQFKSLVAGSGIQFSSSSTAITIATTGSGGDITSGSNLGTGEGFFASKNLGILEFKSLTATTSSLGGVLELSSSNTEISIKRKAQASTFTIQEDWVSTTNVGAYGWGSTTTGAGSGATIVSTGVNTSLKAIGVLQQSTGTNASGRSASSLGLVGMKLDAFTNTFLEHRVNVPVLSTVLQEYTLMFGYGTSATTSTQTTGLYFLYDRLLSGDFWCAVSANGGVATRTVTAIPVTTTGFNKFRIETNASLTAATFYIDNVLVATHSTNLPTASQVGLLNGIFKSLGTTARTALIDYVEFMGNIAR